MFELFLWSLVPLFIVTDGWWPLVPLMLLLVLIGKTFEFFILCLDLLLMKPLIFLSRLRLSVARADRPLLEGDIVLMRMTVPLCLAIWFKSDKQHQ